MSAWRAVVLIGAFSCVFLGGRLWGERSSGHERSVAPALEEKASAPADEVRLAQELARLERRLTTYAAEQAALREELRGLRGLVAATAAPAPEADEGVVAEEGSQEAVDASAERLEEREAALVHAGIAPERAAAITRDLDELALARMSLRYRASREGWVDTPQYADALAALPEPSAVIRDKYGDDAYDRYLYGNLKPNRVVVKSTMAGSPAAGIGLERGDMVISFNGQRIYAVNDLVAAAVAADGAVSVPVTVRRGAAEFVDYVPPGPLGINAGPGYLDPDG